MNQIRQYYVGIFLLFSVLLSEGCTPTNPGGDTTPPGFVQVLVRLEVPGDPNVRGEFDITSQDATMQNIASNLVIRILATASDQDSGISGIAVASAPDSTTGSPQNLRFGCGANLGSGTEIEPNLQFALLPFVLNAPPSPAPVLWQVEAVANPITTTGCVVDGSANTGPVNIEGQIRLIATNGAGLTGQSGTFLFSYADIGIK